MGFAVTFMQLFFTGLIMTAPVFILLLVIIIVFGQIVGAKESWSKFDAFYWSFITASTVGYGDFRPVKAVSKCIAIFIAFCGLVLTGIFVAIAISSATEGLKRHVDFTDVRAEWKSVD